MTKYTYIAKCQNLYKIGKTNNVQKRLKTFQIGNPFIEIVRIIDGGHYEARLHKIYKHKRVSGEWFNITENEVNINIENIYKLVNITVVNNKEVRE